MKRERAIIARVVAQMVFVVALLAAVGGCSTSRKVIKSGNTDSIYHYALRYYEAEEWKKAGDMFDNIVTFYSGTQREDTVMFYYARSKFKYGDFDTATQILDEFRRRFGRSVFLEDAEGMYALSHYYMAPEVTRDQKLTLNAIMSINEFLSRYPFSEQKGTFEELKDELQNRLYEKEFLNAYTYYKIGRYKSAIVAFKNAMRAYPESTFREEVSFYTVASAYELAANSVIDKKADRFLSMLDSYYTFIAEFPESEYRNKVEAMEHKARVYLKKHNESRERVARGEKPLEEEDMRLTRKERKAVEEELIEIEENKNRE